MTLASTHYITIRIGIGRLGQATFQVFDLDQQIAQGTCPTKVAARDAARAIKRTYLRTQVQKGRKP